MTSANVHDSQVFEVLLETHPPNGHEVDADRAYRAKEGIKSLVAKKFKPRLIPKAKRGKPLSSRPKILNPGSSKVRCRVEHVFGSIRNAISNWSLLCLGQGRDCESIQKNSLKGHFYTKKMRLWAVFANESPKNNKYMSRKDTLARQITVKSDFLP